MAEKDAEKTMRCNATASLSSLSIWEEKIALGKIHTLGWHEDMTLECEKWVISYYQQSSINKTKSLILFSVPFWASATYSFYNVNGRAAQ